MKQMEILEKLKELTNAERLAIAEEAVRLIREDFKETIPPTIATAQKQRLAQAAEALLPFYSAGGELTVFTALDSEDFRAER